MMTKMAAQMIISRDDNDVVNELRNSKAGTIRYSTRHKLLSPLPSLSSWHSLLLHRAHRQSRNDRRAQSQRQGRLPVLPHTTLSEILAFCETPTILAFRGVSRVFRDFEIPREFHNRTMKTIHKHKLSDESNRRKQKRRRKLMLLPTTAVPVPDTFRYSYKKKVLDDQDRKVWILLRDTNGDGRTSNAETETAAATATSASNNKSNFDSNPHHWSIQNVTAKVLKLIQDIEFYNGDVFGYDQDRARNLLLEKGWIDEGDFPQPHVSWKNFWKKGFYGKRRTYRHAQDQNTFPAYGNWRAEASVREVSLKEALEMLSGDKRRSSMNVCKAQRRWRSPFRTQRNNINKTNIISTKRKTTATTNRSGSVDDGINFGLSLLLAAAASNGNSTASGTTAAAATVSTVAGDSGVGIRLAEYSTIFEKTKMSCSVLLVRTLCGVEAEVRILSGSVESPPCNNRSSWRLQSQPSGKNLTSSRHSNSSLYSN